MGFKILKIIVTVWFMYSLLVTIVAHDTTFASMCGIITLGLYYMRMGFFFCSFGIVSVIGFTSQANTLNCCFISYILQIGYFLLEYRVIDIGNFHQFILPFSTGVHFWSSLVLCVSLLVISSRFYWNSFANEAKRGKTNISTKNIKAIERNATGLLILSNILALVTLVAMLLMGVLLDIQSMRNTAGVFLVLLTFDMQINLFSKVQTHFYTLLTGIISVNLIVLYKMIEYVYY